MEAVGLADWVPLINGDSSDENVFTDNTTDLRPANAAAAAVTVQVSPGYFEASGTALLSGRAFTWHDDKNAPRVGVVNLEFARKVLGSEAGAVGRYFKLRDGTRVQVVGVVEDGKYSTLTEPPSRRCSCPSCSHPPATLAGGALGAIRSNWRRRSRASCTNSMPDCPSTSRPGKPH